MVKHMKLNEDLFKIEKEVNNIALKGINDTSFCLYINEYFKLKKQNILIVTPTLFEANKILDELANINNQTLFFPMDDFLTSLAISASPDLKITRLETINNLLDNDRHIVVTHLMGLLRFLPTKKIYQKHIIKLAKGNEYPPEKLVDDLIGNGYVRDTIVSKTGDIAVRGYVIDIFPVSSINPVRIEYFGDEIESIRYFDSDSQKSIENIEEILIYPVTELLIDGSIEEPINQSYIKKYSKDVVSIIDYLDNPLIFIKDYSQIKSLYKKTEEQMDEYRKSKDVDYKEDYMHDLSILDNKKVAHYLTHDNLISDKKIEIIDFKMKEVPKFKENLDGIENFINANKGKTIILTLKDYQIKSFTKRVNFKYLITDVNNIIKNEVNIVPYELETGFIYNDIILITDKDLFNITMQKKKYKTKFKYSTKIRDINKLEIGDYIVHNVSGIGVYNGIKTLTTNNVKKDYIEVLYKGNDKLYIPVEKIELISKYSGKEGVVPKINSLNSQEWQKTKMRVANKVKNIAGELIRIYAERKMKKGIKYSEDDELQEMFEKEFEYELTEDQALATKQIKEEMETSHPMDRLLCGDVGFGKTEVAFRAIFKAVENSKQVMYLCPTTILSMQQYNNAIARFQNYPVEIALLNRFVPSSKQKDIIEKFNSGKIDFLIGTHRLLNDAIKPKDLGLLVIDEEQRFGVIHKEKIKKYKSDIDVLTLTATPIPRTLQMSLIGIRSLSLITTPPVNRYPIQTYVTEENDTLIKDAIYKELARHGQVFILYNHVELIEHKVYQIQSLVPEARIIYAHGKMDRNDIENKMYDFINYQADIMICTTIIETGIDIPNVNTLIILEADHFGLSQLYQIRGRVGRSDKIAYAYMMYNPGKVLGDEAIKRLKAIEEFTELGSGFKIANRDLSIRGAGDILGDEQAGFIDSVGIDLYLKILNDEINKLKGEEVIEEKANEPTLMNIGTHISDNYVFENELKIEIHKLINSIDSYEKLVEVKKELEDRFGKIDKEMEIYMYEEWFEKVARRVGIIKINENQTRVEIILSKDKSSKIDGEKLFMESYNISPYFKFNYHNSCLGIVLELPKLDKHYIYYLIKLVNLLV